MTQNDPNPVSILHAGRARDHVTEDVVQAYYDQLSRKKVCRICGKVADNDDLCLKCEDRLEMLHAERLYDR